MMRTLRALFLSALTALSSSAVLAEDETISYYSLKPSLVSNLEKNRVYVRADVQFMITHPEHELQIELHQPAIRHELLLLLMEQTSTELLTAEGKEALRAAALAAVREVLDRQAGLEDVPKELYFTSFYVQ